MKVVYFDYWTGGLGNFIILDSKLKNAGADTLLFHIGSWNDPSVKPSEEIRGIRCHDISFYNTNSLFKVLKQLSPDVIVTLNTTYIVDRIICLACRMLGIRTVFMMHGDRVIDKEKVREIEVALRQPLFIKLLKASKYLSRVIPNYLVVLWRYNKKEVFTFNWIKVLFETFCRPSSIYPIRTDELIQNECLVYANKYASYYRELGYPPERIKVVGNPKHDRLFHLLRTNGFHQSMLPESVQLLLAANQKYCLYIEDAFVEQQNMYGWTTDARNEFINELFVVLKNQGYRLVIKLHPVTKNETIQCSDDILVFQQADLDALIFFSTGCIGFISTVLTSCLLQRKPVLIPQWGIYKKIDSVYLSSPGVVIPWLDINGKIELNIDTQARSEFFKENITVLEEGSLEQICKIILN